MTSHSSSPIILDDFDHALIDALVLDGRATYAALAPQVGLSQASVRTRVQRLLDSGAITVTGRADPTSFGIGVFAFAFLEVGGELDKVAARIGEIQEAVFVVLATGRFDLMVELRCRDDHHLLEVLDRIRVLGEVRRLQSTTVLHYEKQDWTSVGNRSAKSVPRSPMPPRAQLDEVDRELMLALMANGRTTYAALAPRVGLSPAAVRDRVIDLLDSGVVTIAAHPSPHARGIGGFAGVAIKSSGPISDLVDAMTDRSETTLVARTLGRFDVLAEVWFNDADHLAELLEDLRNLAGAGSVDTVPYLRVAKEDFRT